MGSKLTYQQMCIFLEFDIRQNYQKQESIWYSFPIIIDNNTEGSKNGESNTYNTQTISSSCYDAIVIKQQNRTYRSTPFQVVFSNNLIKQIQKNRVKQKSPPYRLSLYVNDKIVDVVIKIDRSGRIVFEKVYNRKMSSMVSDSSDISDEQLSHTSSNKTLDTKISKSKALQDRLDQYKNQQAPPKFWQFAWLFSHKKQQTAPPPHVYKIEDDEAKTNLTKIKQEIYQGQQHSKQPLFHLSLCGNLLKRKQTKQQILKTFYDNRVEYNQFIKDPPGYLNDSNLVIKFDDSLYTWQLGITILTCRFAYGRQLTKQQIQDIIKNKFTKSRLFSFISGASNITKLDIAQLQDQVQIVKKSQEKKLKSKDKPIVRFRKTPDSDIIKKMKLKYGKNIAKFQLDVGEGIKQTVTMKIFLWDHSEKIIISDIDGTITRSDILGQILSKWIHTGVTKLFTQIYKRHYKIIYLTARAIGQYQQTSKFLQTVEQQGIYLPQGPLMMSPDGYMRSFTRQVIYKTPDYLKTKILASLNQIFPNTKSPIYCGFGNRQTDSAAYLKINISPERIFCITDKSIISRESDKQFSSSYKDILTNINDFFPQYFKENPMVDSSQQQQVVVQEYHAVQANQQASKKAKSVDGGQRNNFDGYQSDQLSHIESLSKSRKSEHEIHHQDIKSLQYMKQLQKLEMQMMEADISHPVQSNSKNKVKVGINGPVNNITSALVDLAKGKNIQQIVKKQQILQNQPKEIKAQQQQNKQVAVNQNNPIQTKSLMRRVSKQQIATMVQKQLKQQNQINESEVIPDSLNDSRSQSRSIDSKDLRNSSRNQSQAQKQRQTSTPRKIKTMSQTVQPQQKLKVQDIKKQASK